MASVRIEHTFDCSPDTFWSKVFFDDEYNRRLFKEALGFPEWKVISRDESADRVDQLIDVTPRVGDLPGPLKKIVGDGIGYREKGRFDRKAQRYTIEVQPNKLADKMRTHCELWLEPSAEGKSRRLFVCNVEAKIFGVGGVLERRIIEDMQKSQAISADFTNRYLAEKGLAGT